MAEIVGLGPKSRSTYANYENDNSSVPIPVLERARSEVSKRYSEGNGRTVRLAGVENGRIKVVGTASAGEGADSISDDELVDVPIEMARAEYSGLKIEGDSMMPLIEPGDVAVFRDHPSQRQGLVFAVRKAIDGQIIVKRLVFRENSWKLEPANETYNTEPVLPGDQLLGFLVGIVRTQGTMRTTIHDPSGIR